jgi:stearoyl-CoA desaturase (delta-9 desaturase)
LHLDSTDLTDHHRKTLGEIFAVSDPLKKLIEMRAELAGTWERTNLSRDQLLVELQDWCVRAESSGVAALQDVVLRMRRYVPA